MHVGYGDIVFEPSDGLSIVLDSDFINNTTNPATTPAKSNKQIIPTIATLVDQGYCLKLFLGVFSNATLDLILLAAKTPFDAGAIWLGLAVVAIFSLISSGVLPSTAK